ncbi:DUF2790 domain-containing protein [Pseudomonas sp. C1C7]|uniref:DUF2790 domain-containing protein n=1 Tax=Pseudomonas sp. C1C7 TaxID=2735272 RepID=UPI001585E2DC|nr:DUF2790 domain-containing protein [Pseudomonas sp. C1C7]NUT78522.1 DUF2790 domain-containing protein [Pseudomonas sp. C1C7]
MNSRALLLCAALACTPFAAMAQTGDTNTSSAIPSYHYGMPLHVGKVIALSEPDTLDCEVVTATMQYIDTQTGKPTELAYRKLSYACSYQN